MIQYLKEIIRFEREVEAIGVENSLWRDQYPENMPNYLQRLNELRDAHRSRHDSLLKEYGDSDDTRVYTPYMGVFSEDISYF